MNGAKLLPPFQKLVANNAFSRMLGDEERTFGWSREKESQHRSNVEAPKKLYEGKRSIRLFLASPPRLTLAVMQGKDGGSPRMTGKTWQEKFAHLPPILLAYLQLPASLPKAAKPFSPFKFSIHSYLPATM
jgi:hypothetical protein